MINDELLKSIEKIYNEINSLNDIKELNNIDDMKKIKDKLKSIEKSYKYVEKELIITEDIEKEIDNDKLMELRGQILYFKENMDILISELRTILSAIDKGNSFDKDDIIGRMKYMKKAMHARFQNKDLLKERFDELLRKSIRDNISIMNYQRYLYPYEKKIACLYILNDYMKKFHKEKIKSIPGSELKAADKDIILDEIGKWGRELRNEERNCFISDLSRLIDEAEADIILKFNPIYSMRKRNRFQWDEATYFIGEYEIKVDNYNNYHNITTGEIGKIIEKEGKYYLMSNEEIEEEKINQAENELKKEAEKIEKSEKSSIKESGKDKQDKKNKSRGKCRKV